MRANEKDLAERQFWVFSSKPSGEGDPVQLVEGKLVPSDLQATIDRIHPRDVTIFNGNVNLAIEVFFEQQDEVWLCCSVDQSWVQIH